MMREAVLVVLQMISITSSYRQWRTMYMDNAEDCESLVRNDDMAEGELYMVMSDSWLGESPYMQSPAECSNGFNFGDRLVSVTLQDWWCRDNARGPYLTVYDDCEASKKNMVAKFNCSTAQGTIAPILSSGSCISLYHYRGHTKSGYYFSLIIKARHEIMAFPAGGIAALVVCIMVGVMVGVKVVCVVTGYENRLPKLNLGPEEEKQILESAQEVIEVLQREQRLQEEEEIETAASAAASAAAENLLCTSEEVTPQFHTQVMTGEGGHTVLKVTRSNGSGSHPSTSSAQPPQHYDFYNMPIEGPTTPRLNRFASFKGASIWRSK